MNFSGPSSFGGSNNGTLWRRRRLPGREVFYGTDNSDSVYGIRLDINLPEAIIGRHVLISDRFVAISIRCFHRLFPGFPFGGNTGFAP